MYFLVIESVVEAVCVTPKENCWPFFFALLGSAALAHDLIFAVKGIVYVLQDVVRVIAITHNGRNGARARHRVVPASKRALVAK